MGTAIITLKIMPDSVETDLDALKAQCIQLISEFGGEVGKEEIEPVAFGLKALKLYFVMDENLGSTDDLEEKIGALENVASVDVVDVRRALG